MDYRKYYHLENYLREIVFKNYHREGSIGASDFFCIVIWKANRAKSKIALKLSKIEPDLELCCRKLTSQLFDYPDHKDRLKLLIEGYGFRLPMSSAILSVFYPDHFSVYDTRVCDTLPEFTNLVNTVNFDNLWTGYTNYILAVKTIIPVELNLVEKDHYLWGKSFYDQLQKDICSTFVNSE